MGIFNNLMGQFIDVIEHVDENSKLLVSKYDRPDNEIKQGAKLIVREGQVAVFMRGGQIADIFDPGTYTLNTGNLPILSTLAAFAYGFNSPIKADLYFISTRQFTDNKWATLNPIMLRDIDFNMVRVRGFGTFAFRIFDPEKFIREVIGSMGKVMTYDIIKYFSALITESLVIAIANAKISVLELAMKYRDLGIIAKEVANETTATMGLEITSVIVENLSLPEDVEKMIDEQSGIGMAQNNMETFMQYQSARAMRDAAKQKGGLAGIGAGMAMGNQMAKTITKTQHETDSAPGEDKIQKLREMKSLLDDGILTKEEFDQMKKQLLGL